MKAWELIEQKGWCQGATAKDGLGKEVWPVTSSNACAYCAVGAIWACYGYGYAGSEPHNKLEENLDCLITEWNDDPQRTKAEVVAKLKELDI